MDAKRKGLIGALLLGLVSGPAVALGAAGILGTSDAGTPAMAAPAQEIVVSTTAPADPAPGSVDEAELVTACTTDGPSLVESEADGTITEVQQAALDALREICTDAGMALADPPGPVVVEEVVIVETVTVAAAPASFEEHEDDDDEYEDDEHEDDEHEDDEDDEHEDDEHEDDD